MKRNQIITLSLLTLIMIAATLGLETARNARESALAAPEPPTLAPTLAIGTSHDPVDQQDADADNEEPSSLAQPEAPSASQESLTGMYTPIAEADSGDALADLPGSTALPTRTPGGNTALPTRTPVANPTSAAPPTRTPGANPTSPPLPTSLPPTPTPQTGWAGEWNGYLEQADGSFLVGKLVISLSGEIIFGEFEAQGLTLNLSGALQSAGDLAVGDYSGFLGRVFKWNARSGAFFKATSTTNWLFAASRALPSPSPAGIFDPFNFYQRSNRLGQAELTGLALTGARCAVG